MGSLGGGEHGTGIGHREEGTSDMEGILAMRKWGKKFW